MEYRFKQRSKTAERRARKFSTDKLTKDKSNPAQYNSANTLRNSIIPQSFTKGQRFLSAATGGSRAEFIDVSSNFGSNIASSFGHGSKFTFKALNNNPGPGSYEVSSKSLKKNRSQIK